MKHIEILTNALEYIENNLADSIKTEDIAKECFCSKTALERIFRCINNISVHDYITRRRMTCAGRMLLEEPEKRILDVALDFGFSSNESFTRTFNQVWNCNPSEFRKKASFSELFPKYTGYITIGNGVDSMRNCKNVDISELYDLFSARKGCWFVCGDVKHLMEFNEISRKAGDLAIIEGMRRMHEAAGEDDFVFRIGADEFVMLTDSKDEEYAKGIAEAIKKSNGKTFAYENEELPLDLHVSTVQMAEGCVQYKELFTELHMSILNNK